MARPTLTLDNVPLLMPYMLSHATSNYKQGVGAQPFALHQNIKHRLLPKQKHFRARDCCVKSLGFAAALYKSTYMYIM